MKEAKIVIGANFGDEGKGLMIDYFSSEAKKNGYSCIVVKHNGGSQAGHTVVTDDVRHVFGTFGSGSFNGADTYLADTFIVNPMTFRKEYEALMRKGAIFNCYINKDCIVTTPYDMLINQYIESKRGAGKHGSCGIGIFETIVRNRQEKITIGELAEMSKVEIFEKIKSISLNYVYDRLKELGLNEVDIDFARLIMNDEIIYNFIDDLVYVTIHSDICTDDILNKYDSVLFETGQGLLLDQNNIEYMPHLTPSNTGIQNFLKYKDLFGNADLEACYVTRTYLTRHGAGRFDTECPKDKINATMVDKTNVPNPFQDTLRYGLIDIKELNERIKKDSDDTGIKVSVAITHLNETNHMIATINGLESIALINNMKYLSEGETNKQVYKNNNKEV